MLQYNTKPSLVSRWRAGYAERCPSGSGGGRLKPIGEIRKGAANLPHTVDAGIIFSGRHEVGRQATHSCKHVLG